MSTDRKDDNSAESTNEKEEVQIFPVIGTDGHEESAPPEALFEVAESVAVEFENSGKGLPDERADFQTATINNDFNEKLDNNAPAIETKIDDCIDPGDVDEGKPTTPTIGDETNDEIISTPPQGESIIVEKDNTEKNQSESNSIKQENFEAERIHVPRTYDVLFGRGRPLQKHPGNLRFHKIVNRARETYLNSRKEDKARIARQVMNEIKTSKKRDESSNNPKADTDDGGDGVDSPSSGGDPGRFLKKIGDSQAPEDDVYWVEVTEEVAIEKISHALRGIPRSETRSRKDVTNPKTKRKGPPSPPTMETALSANSIGKVNVESESKLHGIGVSNPNASSTSSFSPSIGIANQNNTTNVSVENQQGQAVLISSLLQHLQQIQGLPQLPLPQPILMQQQQQVQQQVPSSTVNTGTSHIMGQVQQQLMNTGMGHLTAHQLQLQLLVQQQQIQRLLQQQQQLQAQILQNPQMRQQFLKQQHQPTHPIPTQPSHQMQPIALQPLQVDVLLSQQQQMLIQLQHQHQQLGNQIQQATQNPSSNQNPSISSTTPIIVDSIANQNPNMTEALLLGATAIVAAQHKQNYTQNQANQISQVATAQSANIPARTGVVESQLQQPFPQDVMISAIMEQTQDPCVIPSSHQSHQHQTTSSSPSTAQQQSQHQPPHDSSRNNNG